jgi:short-subunit dehydrogenase
MGTIGDFLETWKGSFLSIVVDIAHILKVILVDPLQYIVNMVRGEDQSKVISQFYSGKCIVVTGASSGIGEALVNVLSSIPDTTVIISARNLSKLEETASSCKKMFPGSRVIPLTLDLEQYEHVDEYKDRLMAALEKNGLGERVDVLINNAGISSRGTALDTSVETLEKLMVSTALIVTAFLCCTALCC